LAALHTGTRSGQGLVEAGIKKPHPLVRGGVGRFEPYVPCHLRGKENLI
jgi:hypothetical protein